MSSYESSKTHEKGALLNLKKVIREGIKWYQGELLSLFVADFENPEGKSFWWSNSCWVTLICQHKFNREKIEDAEFKIFKKKQTKRYS